MSAGKVKVSLTLSGDLLARIDRKAARKGSSRSMLIEKWLRVAARHEAEREIDEATSVYYDSLTPVEAAENESLAQSLSRAVRRLDIDGPVARVRKRGASR